METGRLKTLLLAAADAVTFLLAKPVGLAALAAFLFLGLALRLVTALRQRALACEAAGRRLGVGQAIVLALKEIYGSLASLVTILPTLVLVLAGAVMMVGVADSVRKIDEIAANRARISELSAVVRNLERRCRVADVSVLEANGERARLSLGFYDYRSPEKVARDQEVTILGSEVIVDALVLDFAYSEIESGRRVNLVLPYRVFGDKQPAVDGTPLAVLDDKGVPLLYRRSESDIYGLESSRYDERLEELMAIVGDEGERRKAGVVRSLFGAAVRRKVKAGDSFTIWSEQTGGLTIKADKDW